MLHISEHTHREHEHLKNGNETDCQVNGKLISGGLLSRQNNT